MPMLRAVPATVRIAASRSAFKRRSTAMRPKLGPDVTSGSNVTDDGRRLRRQLDRGAYQDEAGIGGEQHVARGAGEADAALVRGEVAHHRTAVAAHRQVLVAAGHLYPVEVRVGEL